MNHHFADRYLSENPDTLDTMQLRQYTKEDGYAVKLTKQERETLRHAIENDIDFKPHFGFAAYAGARREELGDVTAGDVIERESGDTHVQIWSGKRDKYREPPVPEWLASTIETYVDVERLDDDEELIQCSGRTLSRHLRDIVEDLADGENKGWNYVRMHDLRRTWANIMVSESVDPLLIMQWGGWDDWRTFRDHYLQDYSEQQQAEVVESIGWY